MLQLNNLELTTKKRKRVGRGRTRGRKSCRGSKGQKSRSGGKAEIRPFFEGGQMPLVRRIPRRGFVNPFAKKVIVVNLSDLQRAFADGAEVTAQALFDAKVIKNGRNAQIKILGHGELSKKLHVAVHACSASAASAIEQAGGKVSLIKES